MTAEVESAANAMAYRVSVSTGFDPATIITIITTIISLIQNCKKPANKDEANALILEVAENHPDMPPLWMRPAIRSKLPPDRRRPREVGNVWSAIVDDAQSHEEAAMVMAA